MVALGKQLGHGVMFMLGASMLSSVALAQQAGAPIDPYAPPAAAAPAPPPPPAPPPVPTVAPAPPPPPSETPTQSASGGSSISNNNIQANPTNTNTANQSNTSTNTNTNDNRSTATATNNNTIYIYPPAYPPPAPPPVVAPPTTSISPPPLVPPPALARSPYGPPPVLAGRRIRLNCAQLCGKPPALVPPPVVVKERFRPVAIGAHFTVLGMAKQPLAGWGTLYGGGFHMTFRSRGHFGFEFAQDFLKGELRASEHGASITRSSFPVDFTFRGYILPNLDRHHFNFYLGGGFGAMASSIEGPGPFGSAQQSFLEWTLHADAGVELRFNWFALGADAKVMAIARDGNFGDAVYYGGVDNGVVPDKTWGLQGRAYMSFWF